MKLSSKIIVGLILLLTASTARAQTLNPSVSTEDFSGNWRLDPSETSNTEVRRLGEITLTISQDGNVVNLTWRVKTKDKKDKDKVLTQEVKLRTDGRGEDNPGPFGGLKRHSKTFWSYGNLISEYVVTTYVGSNFYRQEARDLWEISKDREVLTIRTEIGEPHLADEATRFLIRPQKYKRVFRRIS